jgi:hypothetical protein
VASVSSSFDSWCISTNKKVAAVDHESYLTGSNADNIVFAIVRNVQGAIELQELAKSTSNIHVIWS